MAAEMLLQYLWEHRLWEQCDMSTTTGDRIQIIDQGTRNPNSGPDFFNAKIMIGNRMWAGNVEIHVRASDWHRHNHDNDPAYDSVILHVVGEADTEITRRDGHSIPQLILPYTPDYRARYDAMVNDTSSRLPCAKELSSISPLYITDWISSLGYERIHAKVERINEALERLNGDWQSVVYVTLARALGFSTNSDAFERLAYATPLKSLLKHRNDTTLLEATLFGQAGFLDCRIDDAEERKYLDRLREDYRFMKAKYDLEQPQSLGWKMGRMRPANFPHRRIAALVTLISNGFTIGRHFSHIKDEASARQLFKFELSGYWVNHYTIGKTSAYAPRALSPESVTSLLINAIIPLLYAYGTAYANEEHIETAVRLLQSLPAESNSIVSIFTDAGIECDDAFTSQALIQLRRNYCEPRKCLYCRIGHRILASKARP